MRYFYVFALLLLSPPAFAASIDIVPHAAPRGAYVAIIGPGVDARTRVEFQTGIGFADAAVAHVDQGGITAIVPSGAISGNVRITTTSQSVERSFIVTEPSAMIAVATMGFGFKQPAGVAVSPTGEVYVADTGNHQIKVIRTDGRVDSIAGNGKPGSRDGAGSDAQFNAPRGLAFDSVSNVLFVADSGNHAIRRVALNGVVTTVAGSGSPGARDGVGMDAEFKTPSALAFDAMSSAIYVADTGNSAIRRVDGNGAVTTIATGFQQPRGVAVGTDGAIYVADTLNHRVCRIHSGTVTVIAGGGRPGYADGPSLAALFHEPSGILSTEDGRVLVTDRLNHRVRLLDIVNGTVGTIAGIGVPALLDGEPATAAFHSPLGMTAGGAIWIADESNDAIRMLLPELRVTAIWPVKGPLEGREVRLFGTGFIPSHTSVMFGGTVARDVVVVSSTELRVTAPAAQAATVDVAITTPAGTVVLANAFTYVTPPAITGITPAKGATAGGLTVSITGSGFISDETEVLFGDAAATVSSATDSSLSVVTPAATPGPVDVTVRTIGGANELAAGFRYFAPPRIDAFQPAQGLPGTIVTLTGENFDADLSGNAVALGSVIAQVTNATPTQLTVLIPPNARTGSWSVVTAGGTATSSSAFVVPIYISVAITPSAAMIEVGQSVSLHAIGIYADGTTDDLTSQVTWRSNDPAIATVDARGLLTALAPGAVGIDARFADLAASATVTIHKALQLPADPASLAPPPDPGIASSLEDEIDFLYTGPNAIQTGVSPATISEDRVSAVRGRVLDRDGAALPGVAVSVLNHPEFGSTLSRLDGYYDLAFNGGRALTLKYAREGYIAAQRRVETLWNEQRGVDDVVLLSYDREVTPVSLPSTALQIARGSVSSDGNGSRQATILFPSGTSGSLVIADGTLQPVPTLSIRATEYTVGSTGKYAMPANLPSTSGYTYCVELTADEAIAAGATEVRFSKPVSVYVENFIGFPVGSNVPAGYYDRALGAWMSSANGRVIKITRITSGVAQIDSNGDGLDDSATVLAAIGIDGSEQRALATLYPAGRTLWRVPVTHFTPWDFNWPVVLPGDAVVPNQPSPHRERNVENSCRIPFRSTIDCHNRTLGEEILIDGTPYSLVYDSGRVGAGQYAVDVNVTGASIPASLKRVDVRITVAGRVFEWQYPPATNLEHGFVWDGMDVYGRRVTGARTAAISLDYVYDAVYAVPAGFEHAWAAATGTPFTAIKARAEGATTQTWAVPLGHMDVAPTGFGGWTFDAQRLYDGRGLVLYDGAENRAADPLGTSRLTLTEVTANDGGRLGAAMIAPAPDGGIYLAGGASISYVSRAGARSLVAGSTQSGMTDDGRPALGSPISVAALAIGPDGSVYFSETTRVRRIVNGLLTTVAGNGTQPNFTQSIDGKTATSVAVRAVDIAVGGDGTLYIAEGPRLSAVAPDGVIRKVAGVSSVNAYSGDNGPAIAAGIAASYVATGNDGTIYFVQGTTASTNVGATTWFLRKVTTDGIIRGVVPQSSGTNVPIADGAPATSGWLQGAGPLAVAADGTILVTENATSYRRVRAINPSGTVTTLIGTGAFSTSVPTKGTWARSAVLGMNEQTPATVRIAADGSVYVVHRFAQALLKTQPIFPKAQSAETFVAAADGSEVYVFVGGRHVKTADAITGATTMTLSYTPDGYLSEAIDRSGGITKIVRDTDGTPTAIVAPNGRRTSLQIRDGVLVRAANESDEAYTFGYDGNLLISRRDPRGNLTEFSYDANGRLKRDADAGGGSISLTLSGSDNDYYVERRSSEGRSALTSIQIRGDQTENRTYVDSTGLATHTAFRDGSASATAPDGTAVTISDAPDPIFGSMAPLRSLTVVLPSGKTGVVQHSRTVQLSDMKNVLSIVSDTENWVINGKTYSTQYDANTKQMTWRTPFGRMSSASIDSSGRITSSAVPGFATSSITYGAQGLVEKFTQGAREMSFTYNNRRELITVKDALGRETLFGYDEAGRMTRETFPDGRFVTYAYDASGNMTAISPPGREAHEFTYSAIDLTEAYNAAGAVTAFAYNRDRQVTLMTRPDGTAISFDYEDSGRLRSLATTFGNYDFEYSSATGALNVVRSPGNEILTYTYDGSLVTRVDFAGTIAGSVAYTYDTDFRVSSENGVAFTYDADGLLTAAGTLTLRRGATNGLLTGTTVGTVSDEYTYNEFGEVVAYVAKQGANVLYSATYGRDAAGRIISRGETVSGAAGETITGYDYDRAGRLEAVKGADGTHVEEFEYDSNGNRTAHRYLGGTETAVYDRRDHLLSCGVDSYTFTANGEVATRVRGGETTTYHYDAFGNMRAVNLPAGRAVEYVLDGSGRRIGKKVDGQVTAGWLYGDQLRVIAQLDATGNVIARFVYGSRRNTPDLILKSGITYRVISDRLGSPRLVVNTATGTVSERIDYDTFGKIIYDSNPGFQPFGFAGGLRDDDTGLLHFGARDYDPVTGRWMTSDPIGFGGNDSNLYAYAYSDPVNFIDPSGLDALTSDLHVLAAMADLYGKANWGNSSFERSALILQDPSNGRYLCYALQSSHEVNKDTIPVIKHPWAVAIIHTHPNGRTELANQGNDPAGAAAYGLPIYALSRGGIHKYVPPTPSNKKGVESTEVDANAYRKANKKNWWDATDSDCHCGK